MAAMTTTLLQLKDQVTLDADVRNHPLFPPTRLTRIINLAQRYVQAQLNGLGLKKFETSVSIGTPSASTFVGTSVKTVPISTLVDMLESPNSVLFVETSDGTTKGLAYPIDPNVFQEQITNSYLAPTLAKPVFTRLAGNLIFAPATITTGTAYFYKAVLDLSADADVSEIPVEFIEFVILKAVMDINELLGKLQNKQSAVSELEQKISDVYARFNSKQNEQNRNKLTDRQKLQ